jgi:hypothetical protein
MAKKTINQIAYLKKEFGARVVATLPNFDLDSPLYSIFVLLVL